MQITTDALDLDLHIYQNNASRVQVFNFTLQNPKKTVHVQFTHDDKYPMGNHYDVITKVDSNVNLNLLSKVAEQFRMTKQEETCIDLTGDDVHSNETYISANIDSTGNLCAGHTTMTAPSTPSTDTQSDTTYFSTQLSTKLAYQPLIMPISTSTQEANFHRGWCPLHSLTQQSASTTSWVIMKVT